MSSLILLYYFRTVRRNTNVVLIMLFYFRTVRRNTNVVFDYIVLFQNCKKKYKCKKCMLEFTNEKVLKYHQEKDHVSYKVMCFYPMEKGASQLNSNTLSCGGENSSSNPEVKLAFLSCNTVTQIPPWLCKKGDYQVVWILNSHVHNVSTALIPCSSVESLIWAPCHNQHG